MFLLSWHGTFVSQPDQAGAIRHEALAGGSLAHALFLDMPVFSDQASLHHAELGMLRIRSAPEHGAICLLRDGFYLCADGDTGLAVFDRLQPAAWESFLPLSEQDAAGLDFILRHRWILVETRQVIRRSDISLNEGFRLKLGPYEVDLATSLTTLATRRRDGMPVEMTVTHGGAEMALVVAEPRSSALVTTELWPPRARRVTELLTFAVHRIVAGREPTQEDFERDVTFLEERQGAAGLEDLLEQLIHAPQAEMVAVEEQPNEAVLEAGLATVKAHLEAAETDLAKAALERLAAAFPDVAELWFRLGDLHHQAAAYGLAQQAWERCVALEPRHEAASLQLAKITAYFGRQMDSINLLSALVAAEPRAQDLRVWLAQRYAELDWMDLVLDTFAPVANELLDWKEANRRRMVARVEELGRRYDAFSAREGSLPPQDVVQHARLAFSLGRLDECAKLLDGFPQNVAARADAHILQADLRLRRDGLREAIATLEAVDGPARENPGLIIALARLHMAAACPEEAAASLHNLARHTPRADALRLLCMLAHSANDMEVLRFATQTWSALHERDTMAAQWALIEAWSDGRIGRIDDVSIGLGASPFPFLIQFWDAKEPPAEIVQAMQTWQNRNPGIVHTVFDDASARAFLAEHCAADVMECYEAAHHPAMQSDIFRLAFLHVRGGIYTDADDVCVRDMRGIFAALSSVELVAVRSEEAPPYLHNNFIAARPGCIVIADALREAVETVLNQTRSGQRLDTWQTTGPGLLTRATARFTADAANAGKVMLLNEAEYHCFSITLDMAYKHTEKGDWRLADLAVSAAPRVAPSQPRAAAPERAQIDAMMMGWAMGEVAPWRFRPLRHVDANTAFDELNETLSWISVFRIANGMVTVAPKPPHVAPPGILPDRTARYERFLQSVMPFLPPGFSTTFCMCMGDAVAAPFDVPVFCFQKKAGWNIVLLPDIDFLNNEFYTAKRQQDRVAYRDKQPMAVFAGSTTGGFITPEIARALSIPRLRSAQYFDGNTKVDFRLPTINQCSSPEAEAILRAYSFCQKPSLKWEEQFRARMIISMDGNGATCSRVAMALLSNSVLLKYESDHVLSYFAGLQPWVHYVPIAHDSDVEKVIEMEARDPEWFAQIAADGRLFAQTYLSAVSLRRYTAMLLRRYEECFSDTAAPRVPARKSRESAPLPPGDDSILLAHIQARGDRREPLGSWIGERGSTLAIEGFVISLAATYPSGLFYKAVMANHVLSDAASSGEYRGTRGENMPVYGLLIELDADFASKYDVEYEASFIDGSRVGPVDPGTLCTAPSHASMEAFRVIVLSKT